MKMLEDFPFMRDHAHNFQPSHWAELHECLSKAFEMGLDAMCVEVVEDDADKEQV